MTRRFKIAIFANTDWYLLNFRLSLFERLRSEGHDDVLLLSPPGPYGARLQALGFRWVPIAMDRRSLHPLREARLIWDPARVLRSESPDIVHNMTIKCAVYGSIAASLAGVPGRVNAVNGLGYVFTSDDVLARALRVPVRRLMRLAFGGKHARLVVQNPDDRRVFESSGLIRPAFIREIPGSGVDCDRFVPAAGRATPQERYRVLLPARLLRDKGVYEFVEAARRLDNRGYEFLIAGEPDPGNPAAVPTDQIDSWQREGLVEILGHVEDMPELFRSVDVVVLPSYREGLPTSPDRGRSLRLAPDRGRRAGVSRGHLRRRRRASGAGAGCRGPGECNRDIAQLT